MQEAAEQYRGYQIVVAPVKDHDELWDFEYRLHRVGGASESRSRAQSVGGYATPDTACFAGMEVARTEVDNLLALESAPPPPNLQAQPQLDLAEFRARQAEILSSYGWVDRQAGIVRIPIERALDLVAERGLPTRK